MIKSQRQTYWNGIGSKELMRDCQSIRLRPSLAVAVTHVCGLASTASINDNCHSVHLLVIYFIYCITIKRIC